MHKLRAIVCHFLFSWAASLHLDPTPYDPIPYGYFLITGQENITLT